MDGYVLCKIYTKDSKQEVQINAQLEEPYQKMNQQPQPNHGTANRLQQQHLGNENQNVNLHQNVDSQYTTGDEVFDLIMEEMARSGSDVQVPDYEPDFHHVDNTVAYLYQQNLPLQVSHSRPNCLPQQEPAYESAAVHDVGFQNQYMELSAIMEAELEDELLDAEVFDRIEGSYMKLLMED